jgi:hypothetical protein
MEVLVCGHATDRFRTRMKNGRRFTIRAAAEWLTIRAKERLGSAQKVVDQNGKPRQIVDLNDEICAVLGEGQLPGSLVMLTVLTQEMKAVSLKEGWWLPYEGSPPAELPLFRLTWLDGNGDKRVKACREEALQRKIDRLVRGGIDRSTIETSTWTGTDL